MSPVSPVFHAVVTVSIGLKNQIHSIIFAVYVEQQSTQNFPFLLFQCKLDKNLVLSPLWEKINFQTEVPDLIQDLMEDRLRHARGPVYNIQSITLMPSLELKFVTSEK